MRHLMTTIVATACLCAVAAEEGRDLKSLVRPQTFLSIRLMMKDRLMN